MGMRKREVNSRRKGKIRGNVVARMVRVENLMTMKEDYTIKAK